MFLPPYRLGELSFTTRYQVYFRWHTRWLTPVPALATLDDATLQSLVDRLGLRVLECNASPTQTLVMVQLAPAESVSAAASKLKGQLSKWLRGAGPAAAFLGRGYFSCGAGPSTRPQVVAYLDKQPGHHGYAGRSRPPVHVAEFEVAPDRLAPAHACAVLDFHLVFVAWQRRGVFGAQSGPAVTARWRTLESQHRFGLRKVSFVPDHVHVAVRLHPATAPGILAVAMLNAAQEVMNREFSEDLIQAGVRRLWQPEAYIGSYGNLRAIEMSQYVRDWQEHRASEEGIAHV